MDFQAQAKCSNITEQDLRNMNWIRVSIAIAGFIMVAVMLLIVLLRREFKTVLERLFIYLLLATFFRELVLLSNVEHQFEYRGMDKVCSILGALNLYTAVLVIIFVASTIMYLLIKAVGIRKKSKSFATAFELGFVILTILVPLLISVGLLYTDIFGLSIASCWMREFDSNCHKTDSLKKIFGGYSFLLITDILSIFLTVAIVTIHCKVARTIRKASDVLKQAAILLLCLIINVLIIVFAATVENLTTTGANVTIFYIHAVVISVSDLIYPLGLLLSLRYQAICSLVRGRRRRSTYTMLSEGVATAPLSWPVSVPSYTMPFTSWETSLP